MRPTAQIALAIGGGLLDPLVAILRSDQLHIQQAATRAMAATAAAATAAQLRHLADAGAIPALCGLLAAHGQSDNELLPHALRAIGHMLQGGRVVGAGAAEEGGPRALDVAAAAGPDGSVAASSLDCDAAATARLQVIECGGLDAIRSLLQHADDAVHALAAQLQRRHFPEEDQQTTTNSDGCTATSA